MSATRFTNRLASEKSPYLLQHQHNAVDWYPWGSEAFEKAKEMDRPIFLSVGYSTCHWCHVMEKESFENEDIARLLNNDFISIKVDREERPDVDKLYMGFIQATSGSGGWPMTVFLTPDLDPITGGTYFPPRDSQGSLGLPSVLKIVAENWSDSQSRRAIERQGQMITDALKKGSLYAQGNAPPLEAVINGAFEHKVSTFDEVHGGFGNAPKFPKACDLEFLINHFCWTKSEAVRDLCNHMITSTLDGMSRGGIHDHIGKGFHRYSVDGEWHVPHFEKMLYDQAQLLAVYSEHCQVFGPQFNSVIEDIVQYMEECLSHEEGGFYAAEDADSLPKADSCEKKEGAFYVWEMSQIQESLKDLKVLGKDTEDVFCQYFDIQEEGNVTLLKDPRGELQGQNVLRMTRSHEEFADEFGVPVDVLSDEIAKAKAILIDVRSSRPRPHLDSKMVCSWQGLAITGLAKAAMALVRDDLAERATKTVAFVKKYLMDEDGRLLRSAYRGNDGSVDLTGAPILAFSDDYAMLVQGLLDLYEVTADASLLKQADQLQKKMDALFWDSERHSGYYMSEERADVKVRVMEDQDGAEPCANSVAAGNLVHLYEYFGNAEYKRKAGKIVEACSSRLIKYPFILTKLIPAYHKLVNGCTKIVVVGPASDNLVKEFRQEIKSHFVWNRLVLYLDPSVDNSFLTEQYPLYEEMLKRDRPSVFICANFTCGSPITTVDELKVEIKKLNV
ncbi:hypothetical protein Q1695_012611 [Nippostrongylus brasiliensis]|nr:hypothetical protein Q1695_012611 [Nippostrongylus brasiliensis]